MKVTNRNQIHSWYKLAGILCLPIEDTLAWSSCPIRAVPFFFSTHSSFLLFPSFLVSFCYKNEQKRKGVKGTCPYQVFPLFPSHHPQSQRDWTFFGFYFFHRLYPGSKPTTFPHVKCLLRAHARAAAGNNSILSTGINLTYSSCGSSPVSAQSSTCILNKGLFLGMLKKSWTGSSTVIQQ